MGMKQFSSLDQVKTSDHQCKLWDAIVSADSNSVWHLFLQCKTLRGWHHTWAENTLKICYRCKVFLQHTLLPVMVKKWKCFSKILQNFHHIHAALKVEKKIKYLSLFMQPFIGMILKLAWLWLSKWYLLFFLILLSQVMWVIF